MVNSQSRLNGTHRMVGMAIFTAIIVVLQFVASLLSRFANFPISLVLVPIVVGAAVYGPRAGAWFGGVFGAVVLIAVVSGLDLGGNILWIANPFLTVLLCLIKGIAAGWAAGLVYTAIAKKRPYLGVFAAAVVCPIVNTGIFCLALVLFFRETLVEWAGGTEVFYYIIFTLVGINFLIEFVINLILCPTVARIIRLKEKA